jgi:hypothetical protein
VFTRNGAASATDRAVSGGRKASEQRTSSRHREFPQTEQLHWLAIYDGQQCIGHALSRGKLGVEAFDVQDRSLGIYARLTDAIGACDRVFEGGAP